MFKLPQLPYETSAFGSWLTPESFDFHYGKHHKAYIDKLNAAIEGTADQDATLEEIAGKATGGLFNNAAQAWNHTFFWNCITPGGNECTGEILEAINTSFGSLDEFVTQFKTAAAGQFGSGWAWLVKDSSGKLEVTTTSNAEMPKGKIPVLTCDVWEHAYYIDHRNARPTFLDGFTQNINWSFVNENFKGTSIPNMTTQMR